MAQQLRRLVALPEDSDWSAITWQLTTTCTSSPGVKTSPLLASISTRNPSGIYRHTCRQNTHMCKIQYLKFFSWPLNLKQLLSCYISHFYSFLFSRTGITNLQNALCSQRQHWTSWSCPQTQFMWDWGLNSSIYIYIRQALY